LPAIKGKKELMIRQGWVAIGGGKKKNNVPSAMNDRNYPSTGLSAWWGEKGGGAEEKKSPLRESESARDRSM